MRKLLIGFCALFGLGVGAALLMAPSGGYPFFQTLGGLTVNLPNDGSSLNVNANATSNVGVSVVGNANTTIQSNVSNTSGGTTAAANFDVNNGVSTGGLAYLGTGNTGAGTTSSQASDLIVFNNLAAGRICIATNGACREFIFGDGGVTVGAIQADKGGGSFNALVLFEGGSQILKSATAVITQGAGTCNITAGNASNISGCAFVATGQSTVTLSASFSSAPICVVSDAAAGTPTSGLTASSPISATTTTAATVFNAVSGVLTNGMIAIVCVGT